MPTSAAGSDVPLSFCRAVIPAAGDFTMTRKDLAMAGGQPDMALTYQQIQAVSTTLNNAVLQIVPELTSLQSQVHTLLSPEGGLWMDATSPALQQSYDQFNTSLTTAVHNIDNFATEFNQIAAQVRQMDSQMASSISGAGGAGGGGGGGAGGGG
jgi:uncharacterized protein YukE